MSVMTALPDQGPQPIFGTALPTKFVQAVFPDHERAPRR